LELNNEFLLTNIETLDDMQLGNMKIIQPRNGYRFAIDAVLLAFFANLDGINTAIDLGTGSGVIPLILSHRSKHIKVKGIELLDSAVDRARRNMVLNGLAERVEIIHSDIKDIEKVLPRGGVDLVLSNPPFWKKGEGRISKNYEEALARHEININLNQIVSTASYLLSTSGKFCIIQRADRLDEALMYFQENNFRMVKIRLVYAFADREANLVLLEGQKSGKKKLITLPPLVIYKKVGIYTEELNSIYER